ncbi:MAG: GEVED domain-containing protein [Chitinophagaceae bacterium]
MNKNLLFLFPLLLVTTLLFAQTNFTIGSNQGSNINTNYPCAIPDYYEGNRSQYLYLAAELQAMGMSAGTISSIKFNVTALNNFTGDIGQYSISIAGTSTASLSLTSWETMFQASLFGPVDYVPTLGLNEFVLSSPFIWNGVDNIVVDICNGRERNDTLQDYSYNLSTAWTVNLPFNASHTYRSNNLGNLCNTLNTQNLAKATTRPDITFVFTYSNTCSGTPIGGTTISSKDTVCANDAINLYITGSSYGAGLTYQWQESVDGINYDSIPTANSFSYNLTTGIGASTYFRRKISCSGVSSYSAPVFIYVKPFYECYCSPKTGVGLYISSTLSIETVSIKGVGANYSNYHAGFNPAPNYAYAAFLDTTAGAIPTLKQAQPYQLTINTNTTPVGAGFWIDWDHNGLFDSSEYKQIKFATDSTQADTTIDIAATAPLGLTMMRIRTSTTAFNYSNPCTLFNNGETEDYLFKVVSGDACNGMPNGGIAKSTDTLICPNTPFYLTTVNATDSTVVTYQWESSIDNGQTWQPVYKATLKNCYIYGITTPTRFRRKIICGSNIAYSSTINILLNSNFNCTCSPNNGTTLHFPSTVVNNPSIETVAITGNTLSYVNSNPGINATPSYAYSIYNDTSLAPELAQSVTYTITITTNLKPNSAGVFIDWNNNGVYEASEYQAFAIPAGATTISTLISVSSTALGYIGMRIRVDAGFLAYQPCRGLSSGETEDYVLKITSGILCSATPVAGITEASAASVCHYEPIYLSVSGASSNLVGLSYQWQDSAIGGSWINIANHEKNNDTVSQVVTKYYRRKTTCATSGLYSYSVPVMVDLNAPIYAVIPFTESFETTWQDGCGGSGSRCTPTKNWRNNPTTGDASWRRNDDGVSANWTVNTYSAYSPAASAGNYSARFHTSQGTFYKEGNLDLFLDCSNGVAAKRLTYDFMNVDGNDSMRVYLSTDAGLTFTKIDKAHLSINSSWTTRIVDFNSASATTVIRFNVGRDFGISDIGLDNISINSNILPYKSIEFSGEKVGNVNQLKWIVTNEIGVEYYDVEKSVNGVEFNKIGSLNSKASSSNSNTLSYFFTDKNSLNTNCYYRLKQVAKDGSIEYSNIIFIKGLKISDVVINKLYPNPVKNALTISIASPSNKNVSIVVTNAAGKTVQIMELALKQGDNQFAVKTNKLDAGNYFISIVDTDKNTTTESFIKIN